MQAFPYILLLLGVLLTGSSLVAWFGGPLMFGEKVKLEALESSQIPWFNSSHFKTDNYLKVYFFNVTNTVEVIAGGKPNLQEVGPYVFEDIITRIVESIDKENDVVSYKDQERFHFRSDLSNGKESDILTLINVPYVGLAQQVSKLSSFPRIMVMGVIARYHEGLFLTKTAKELLFGGYKHELLATLSSITGEQYMMNNTFGLFYERNNSDHGSFSVSMGLKDPTSLGKIQSWNHTSRLKWWKSDACNKIDGSYDGTLFPSGETITKDTILSYFDPGMCRKFRFAFKKEVKFHTIKAYRFTLLKEEFEDPRIREENMCYCTSHGDDQLSGCPKRGSYQLNACAKEASVSLSLPHFLYGADEYLTMATGFHPDETKHEPFIEIDPVTGTMLKIAKRSQANLEVKPLRLFSDFRKVKKMLFPAIWVEETMELPTDRIQEASPSLFHLLKLSSFGGLGVGIVLIFISLGIIIVRMRKDRTKYNT